MSNMSKPKGFLYLERDWLKSRLQNTEQGVFLEINNQIAAKGLGRAWL